MTHYSRGRILHPAALICGKLLLMVWMVSSPVTANDRPVGYQKLGYQKPGANVYLVRPKTSHWPLNAAKTLHYTFQTPEQNGTLTVYFSYDDAFVVTDPKTEYVFHLADGTPTLSIELIAEREGKHSLRFYVEQGGLARAMAHRITIGDVIADSAASTLLKAESLPSNKPKLKLSRARETLRAK